MNLWKEIKHRLFGYWEHEYDLLYIYCEKLEEQVRLYGAENKQLKELVERATKAAEEALKSR